MRALDIVAPVLMAAWGVGRLLGPQLMVAGGGHPTHEWFGMYYAGQVGKRLPVPILQAIDSFIIFGILLLIERYYRDRPVGFVLAATMALWGLTRFYEERLWLGEIGHLGSVLVQVAGLALFAAGLVVMVVLYRRHRRGTSPPTAGPTADADAGDADEVAHAAPPATASSPPRRPDRSPAAASDDAVGRPRGRPGPGGPANACAISSHCTASGALRPSTPCPTTWRRWVTTRQKSSAGPSTSVGARPTVAVPLPLLPRRPRQLARAPRRRGLEAADDVRERSGPHPEMGDVAQAGRGHPGRRPGHRRRPGRGPRSP